MLLGLIVILFSLAMLVAYKEVNGTSKKPSCAVSTISPRLVKASQKVGETKRNIDQLNRQLKLALSKYDFKLALSLVKEGANPNIKSEGEFSLPGETLLMLAAGTRENKFDEIKFFEELVSLGADVNFKNYLGESVLHRLAHKDPVYILESFEFFINAGVDINARDKDGRTPLHFAYFQGQPGFVMHRLVELGADLNAKSNDGKTVLFCARTGEAMQDLLSNGFFIGEKDKNGNTALFDVIAGTNGCADENDFNEVCSATQLLLTNGADIDERNNKGETPLHRVATQVSEYDEGKPFGNLGGLKFLLDAGADPDAVTPDRKTPLHFLAERKSATAIQILLQAGADPSAVDQNGKTPLDLAVDKQNLNIAEILRRATTAKGAKTFAGKRQGAASGTSIMSPGFQAQGNSSEQPISLSKTLFGLVGMDYLSKQIELDLQDFASRPESRARLFWGAPGCGKTEFAQRLAGLREGVPGLKLGNRQVVYASGVDGKLEIRGIVDQLSPGSVLLIDEADKSLDPSAGMVNSAEATQLQHAIVTHFARKPIYWIFLGTFSAMRGSGKITQEALVKTLGPELASRIDFADWEFPSWTLENLLKAVKGVCSRRGVIYEDEALLLLTQYCLKMGGGVRAFDNLDQALSRRVRSASQDQNQKVTPKIAADYLSTLGYRAAA